MTSNLRTTSSRSTSIMGAAGTESWATQDPVKGGFKAHYSPLETPKRSKSERLASDSDLDVSPHTVIDSSRIEVVPWEADDPFPPAHRKDLSFLNNVASNVPSISHQPPSATNSTTSSLFLKDPTPSYGRHNKPSLLPGNVFNANTSFVASQSISDTDQFSPTAPSSSADPALLLAEVRRPSIASTSTMSSTGSGKGSITRMLGKSQRKLQGFFGDDYNMGVDPARHDSDASSQTRQTIMTTHTGGVDAMSFADRRGSSAVARPISPDSNRPRPPMPSSEVTPWAFQELETTPSTEKHHSHAPSFGSIATIKLRPQSPSGSMGSTQSKDVSTSASRQASMGQGSSKRSIFARVTGRHKDNQSREAADHQYNRSASPSVTGVESPRPPPSSSGTYDNRSLKGRKQFSPDYKSSANRDQAKKDHSRLPFKHSKRTGPIFIEAGKFPNNNGVPQSLYKGPSSVWDLDTDLGNMEGIIDDQMRQQSLMMTPPPMKNEPIDGFPFEPAPIDEAARQAAWDAPDSWAVKRTIGGLDAVADADTAETSQKDTGPLYFMRIFRADSTFAVISAGLNTSAAELISMMARKSYLQEDMDEYQMVMRKRGLSRQLIGAERPLQMQKRLLELAGYQESDHLEDLGREDQGYLCRFTFLSNKVLGYTSLEKDTGVSKMQKFNHIDLSGRNLVTIPITLYQKAAEIITLNLSQNLSLDIPKDFMQSCVNLREVKYTSNEAEVLPSSFAMACKLTMVDFSNNRLESLDYSDLSRLTGLISLKLSNNVLKSLPDYFGSYQALRSLNLASNSLVDFPNFLGELRSLVDLDISFNSISSMPTVGKLINLERLFATNNKLSGSFPDNLKDLVSLHSLDVRFNAIDNIDVTSSLPRLEHLMVGHNSITAFEGTFARLKLLIFDHNPVTRFGFTSAVPTLSVLNLASAKLATLSDDLYAKMPALTKLVLNKNHFVSLSPQIGKLTKLEHLSVAKNELGSLPPEIGLLQNLKYLDVRENNLGSLPTEIWYAKRLESLNLASNVLVEFPKPGLPPKELPGVVNGTRTPSSGEHAAITPEGDELGKLEGFQLRRPSYVPGMASSGGSPGSAAALRKGSIASAVSSSRNPSLTAKSSTESGLGSLNGNRKDSTLSNRLAQTFATSIRILSLADNRLEDDCFAELSLLTELRQLNLSYNRINDMPPRTIKRWPNLAELYLSGNDLTSLPTEDLDDGSSLRALHLNGNKFQVLPAEIGQLHKLQTLDVASNVLKYNVTNWPYDWNWNYNGKLRYLNLSGNKRLEIRPNTSVTATRGETRDLTDFSSLTNLRILGLMDVTLMIGSVPDEHHDRRVRTAGSTIGTSIPYGMADTLGRAEHVSTFDMVIPTFQGHDDQFVFGLFDGQLLAAGGSKVARFLQERFRSFFAEELEKLRSETSDTPSDALRRTYLGLNKELATVVNQAFDLVDVTKKPAVVRTNEITAADLGEDDLTSGAVATVCYLSGMTLYVSNVGDAQALLISSEGGYKIVTQKHDPAEAEERQRIKQAGGFVSRQGKMNDVLEVSRAFGYVQFTPVITAAPHVSQIELKETDEMILLASRELWEYLTFDFAVDMARSERSDLMVAAQKLRDLAIAFGATSNIMVMIIGVSDLRRRERAKVRTHSMSMGPSGVSDDYFTATRRTRRPRDGVVDSKLARLDQEVDAPQGTVSLVFTDIKNSTMLWESHPDPMRSAIKLHNEVMRRQLRIIGGYEVKTEGDAFMVAFATVTSALLWCFAVQLQLLDVRWPQEILNSFQGQEIVDDEGRTIFRGLSVRMGIHYGRPVCEVDPVTKRMDYFGPMVNRAARISSVADGGQITVSKDFIEEIQTLLEMHIESDRNGSVGSDDALPDDLLSVAIKRELKSLGAQGFEVKDLGMRTLKGLENPEYIYSMYPHSLASRRILIEQREAASGEPSANAKAPISRAVGGNTRETKPEIATEMMYALWRLSVRLELLCSTLECPGINSIGESALCTPKMQEVIGAVSNKFLIDFVENQVARIEACTTTLVLRHMLRPLSAGFLSSACPIGDVLGELGTKLELLRAYEECGMKPISRIMSHASGQTGSSIDMQ